MVAEAALSDGEEDWEGAEDEEDVVLRRGGGGGREWPGGEGTCRTVCVRPGCKGPEGKNEAPGLGLVSKCLCWEPRFAPDC